MKKKTFRIERAATFKDNPRKITPAQRDELAASMERLGDISGLVFNRRSGQWVGGNQRADIMELNASPFEINAVQTFDLPDKTGTVALGMVIYKGIPFACRVVDWDEATEREANIAANAKGGAWDFQIIRQNWDLPTMQAGGFDPKEWSGFSSHSAASNATSRSKFSLPSSWKSAVLMRQPFKNCSISTKTATHAKF